MVRVYSKSGRVPQTRRAIVATAGLLAMMLALWCLHSAFVIAYPMQMDHGEGCLASLCAVAADGKNLYPPLDRYPYVRTSYTPLYLLASGLLIRMGLRPFAGPRLLSALSFVALLVLLGWSLNRHQGHLIAIFTLAFVAINALVFYWSAVVRVDMLALLFDVAVPILIIENRPGAAGVASSLAFFTKPTMIGGGVSAAVFLAIRDRRALVRFLGIAMVMLAVGAAACHLTWGRDFWAQVFGYNMLPYNTTLLWFLLGNYGASVTLLALISLLIPHRRPLLWWLYLGCGLLGVVGCGRLGAYYNYFLPLLVALGICAATALGAAMARGRRLMWMGIGLVQVGIGATVSLPPYPPAPLSIVHVDVRDVLAFHPPQWFQRGVGMHQAMCYVITQYPGEVLADNVGNVVACGRTAGMTDPAAMYFLSLRGAWDEKPLLDRISTRHFALITLDTDTPWRRFSPTVLKAIEEAYEPKFEVGDVDRILLPRAR